MTVSKKKLSVVIITCNRTKELLIAIESCVEHSREAFELVIVDNDSTEDIYSALSSFCDEKDIPLIYKKLDKNYGVSYARNVGFKLANGDVLFFIDDDAVVSSSKYMLDDVVDYLFAHTEVFACSGVSLDPRYNGKIEFVRAKNEKCEIYQIRSYIGFNHFIKKKFTDRNYIYPNNLFYGSEELYVGLTILKNEGIITFLPYYTVRHNPSLNTRIDKSEGKRNGHINTFVIKKYFLPFPYQILSCVLFFFRTARFCKFNPCKIISCYCEVKKRYDKSYDNKMSCKQVRKAIKLFGINKIL